MIEMLTQIWRRVLQQPCIGVEDNFFDLGGDPSLAVRLFTEIARVCGRELPPETIYLAPTVASLAALLENPSPLRFPAVVLLKSGAKEPPIFMTHGIGGRIMELFYVVRHIRSSHPVYGMQAKGIDGVDKPAERIEDMAELYLDAIKKLQPRGPYCLIGDSVGGLVTFEMAQRLSANGEKIALLALLDSYPDERYLPLIQRAILFARRARRRATRTKQLSMREALSYHIRFIARRLHISADPDESTPNQPPTDAWFPQPIPSMVDSGFLALARYRPRSYSGKVKFVKAEIKTVFSSNPAAFWADLVEGLEIETVPGDHLGMITAQAESLASVLSRYVREAFGEESGRADSSDVHLVKQHSLSQR